MRRRRLAALLGAMLTGAGSASAQDPNILLPVPELERRLGTEPFTVLEWRGSREADDRTQRVTLGFGDGGAITVKWACAPYYGSEFNNEPRYELAAYALQKLFLEEAEYVVPPTVIRSLPLDMVRALNPAAEATFSYRTSVLVVLQYWLSSVTPDGYWDEARFGRDTAYARALANFNVLTYLIRHKDENEGNFLVSTDSTRPRVFSVDNGLSFRSLESNRGQSWRKLRVDRIPAATVVRLRTLTEADLKRALGVLAQFETVDSALVPARAGKNVAPREGVRQHEGTVQFGLTRGEIASTHRRIRQLLERVDQGKVRTF